MKGEAAAFAMKAILTDLIGVAGTALLLIRGSEGKTLGGPVG